MHTGTDKKITEKNTKSTLYAETIFAGMFGNNSAFNALLPMIEPDQDTSFLTKSIDANKIAVSLLKNSAEFEEKDDSIPENRVPSLEQFCQDRREQLRCTPALYPSMLVEDFRLKQRINQWIEDKLMLVDYLELTNPNPSYEDFLNYRRKLIENMSITSVNPPLSEAIFTHRKLIKSWIEHYEKPHDCSDVDLLFNWVINLYPREKVNYDLFVTLAKLLQETGFKTEDYDPAFKKIFNVALQKRDLETDFHFKKLKQTFEPDLDHRNMFFSRSLQEINTNIQLDPIQKGCS